jgi:hypothetical protein
MMDGTEPDFNEVASPLEQALIREGRAYRCPDQLRTRTLEALGVAASAGLASRALAWVSARSWTTKVILSLSTGMLVAAIPSGYFLLGRKAPPSTSSSAVPVSAPPVPSTPTPPAGAPSVAAQAADVPGPATPPPVRAPTAASASSDLRAELAALDKVRTTLSAGDPDGALSLLASYLRTFPRGRLRLEAEVLRIDALARSGQTALAARQAQSFLERHPNSVLAERVRPYAKPR